MSGFNDLKKELDYLELEQLNKVEEAFSLANAAHEGQKRVSGDPYICHPVEVTKILASYMMDYESIIAGLLHDVIEDTQITKIEIKEQFGDQVANLVDGLSKLKKAEFKNRTIAQGENFRKMLLAMANDIRVIIIKLADRLHNIRTIHVLSDERRTRIATETLEIFSPIARRLGMHDVSLELEDLSFKTLYPKRYRVLQQALRKIESQHQHTMQKILNRIRDAITKAGIKLLSLESRKKNLYSIYLKMKRKRLSFSELTDVFASRIILTNEADCYRVLGIVHKLFMPLYEKFKDYIAVPKPNGYQSLHTVLFGPSGIPIEVQIRTQMMEEMASSGIAAHWQYKIGKFEDKEHRWLESLISIQKVIGNSEEFIKNVKMDLFNEEVYVFTPAGEIIELPHNATAMDFAFAVHTEIGKHCVAAKIDRQLAPLSSVLSNGQTVEIITAESASPSAVWLDIVVTPKAKTTIHNHIKNQQKKESIDLGEKLLAHSFQKYNVKLKDILDRDLNDFLIHSHCHSLDDLYMSIGMGNFSPDLIAEQIINQVHPGAKRKRTRKKTPAIPMPIKGTEGYILKYADCCYPIPGDPIIGILTAGKGLLVHCESCAKTLKVRKVADRYIHLEWSLKDISKAFLVPIKIYATNHKGVLASITSIISELSINIQDLEIHHADEKHVHICMYINVKDRNQLANLIKRLRILKYVDKIARYTKQ